MDICLVIYGGKTHTLYTSYAGKNELNLLGAFYYPLLSFLPPKLCLAPSLLSVYSRHPANKQQEKDVSIIGVYVNFFVT